MINAVFLYDSSNEQCWTVFRARTDNPEFSADQLMMTILDLFGAGADTTSSTLTWALLFLSLHPELQELCHQEVREHTGLLALYYSFPFRER